MPKIRIAEDRLSTALLNICINARDAIGGAGKVEIVTKLQTRNLKQYLMISIEDNGPGMDADGLEKITERFFTTKTYGTGLGLAMVRNFVDESRGILEFDSEKNMGLKVSMFFPLPAIRKHDPPSKHK
ncbi:MAG: ATP-binding protein [Pseudomonadales bacterium]|nr:ATP-binding protein [Pseudomonadales bacterium]